MGEIIAILKSQNNVCTDAFCNKPLSHFVATVVFGNITVEFCNKKADAFCNKLSSHFVIIMSHFVKKSHNEPNMKPKLLLTPKTRFPFV